ncbi:MAG: amino acid racemase [Bacteroidota bacterium]|nr:amino acid racemase [Bacteroidota bacterium]MDP4254104.1 amino acid racemase [Bacteroidota bacterium]
MKTLGLIGGTTWLSTIDYYRIINQEVNRQLGELHSAKLILYSIDFDEFKTLADAGDWPKLTEWFAGIAQELHTAGADAIVLCANTLHLMVPKLEQLLQIPIIHVADATVCELRSQAIRKTVLLGTRFTMEAAFFKDKLLEQGIEVMTPDKDERQFIHHTIFAELDRGLLLPETKVRYLAIIENLIAKGAGSVILGCTEIPLLIKPEDCTVPVFDTTLIHAKAAAKFALA